MFKQLSRDREDTYIKKIELLDVKIICEMKNTLHGINDRLDITDEKMTELVHIGIETI